MGRIQRWSGVTGTFSTEIEEVPAELSFLWEDCEVVIEFESSGYYDPGRFSGPPEKCYPPEREDERTPIRGYAISCLERMEFSPDQLEAVFEYFKDEIQEVELDDDPM